MHSVKQILDAKSGDIFSVEPELSVLEVMQKMAEHSIGSVLVMQGDSLLGIATERDYARKVILKGLASADTPVSTIMSTPVITVAPDQLANDCMQLMTDKRIRHLPVRDDGKIVGILSIGDLLKTMIKDQQDEIEQLHQYISG